MSKIDIKSSTLFKVQGVDDDNPILGFAFKDSVRCKIEYKTSLERAWCECSELCDQQLWDEADRKFDDVNDIRTTCTWFDAKLYSRIKLGQALSREAHSEEEFIAVKESLEMAISEDDGSKIQALMDQVYELIVKRISAFCQSGRGGIALVILITSLHPNRRS